MAHSLKKWVCLKFSPPFHGDLDVYSSPWIYNQSCIPILILSEQPGFTPLEFCPPPNFRVHWKIEKSQVLPFSKKGKINKQKTSINAQSPYKSPVAVGSKVKVEYIRSFFAYFNQWPIQSFSVSSNLPYSSLPWNTYQEEGSFPSTNNLQKTSDILHFQCSSILGPWQPDYNAHKK